MENLPEFIANHLFLCSLFAALLMLLLWNLFGDSMSGNKAITPPQVTQMINRDNAVVIDIRPQEQFNSGHIINALNIPKADFDNPIKKLEKHKKNPVILYCQTGNDSSKVSRLLKQSGFEQVSFLKGGLMAWQNASLPVSK